MQQFEHPPNLNNDNQPQYLDDEESAPLVEKTTAQFPC